jgi:hypothetical protein
MRSQRYRMAGELGSGPSGLNSPCRFNSCLRHCSIRAYGGRCRPVSSVLHVFFRQFSTDGALSRQPHDRLLAGRRRWRRGQRRQRRCGRPPAGPDPDSDLNRQWDEEHDRYVIGCLLDRVEQEFEPTTLRAFRRLALEGASGAEVAGELGLSVAAVDMAKSRVLERIRSEAEGLID